MTSLFSYNTSSNDAGGFREQGEDGADDSLRYFLLLAKEDGADDSLRYFMLLAKDKVLQTRISVAGVAKANGKCETLRDGDTSVFLCKPKTFWLFKLRDRDFKGFYVRTLDFQNLKIRAPDLVES